MNLKSLFQLIKDTFSEWSQDNAARLAAALSYYTTFSIAPLLVVVIALAGLFGAGEAAQNEIMIQVENLIGVQGREFLQDMIITASQTDTGMIAAVVGAVTLLFAALGVFAELKNSLNTIWEVKPKPAEGMLGTIKRLILDRLLSFTMVLVVGFLLLVSLVLSAALAFLGEFLGGVLPVPELFLQVINFVLSFAVITLLFAMIFKFLPDADIAWRDVWLGAAFTALLFTLGKFALGFYLGRSDIGTSFGAAGSLVIILIWVYYSAQILFLGAEFTQVYANQYGSRIVPSEDAVKVTEVERAQQGIPHRETVSALSKRAEPGTGLVAQRVGRYSPRFTYARTHRRSGGLFDKALYSLILASQFIPSLRSMYASENQRTTGAETSAGSGPAARN